MKDEWLWLVVMLASWHTCSAQLDTTVCQPAQLPVPPPPPSVKDLYSAVIEWKEQVTNYTYVVRDYYDLKQQFATLIISWPLEDDVTLIFDFANTLYSIITDGRCDTYNSQLFFNYKNKPWLSSLKTLYDAMLQTKTVVYAGESQVRNYGVSVWTTCMYDFMQNMTLKVDILFTEPYWLVPNMDPLSRVPVQLRISGKQHLGSGATITFNATGEIIKYSPFPTFPENIFVTPDGVFCNGRYNTLPFPQLSSQLSLTLEVIDLDYKRIAYEKIWFDSVIKASRFDTKDDLGNDDDPTSKINDFTTGLSYNMDTYLGECEVNLLQAGDRFVFLDKNRIRMTTIEEYFSIHDATIQYVGQKRTRGVLCNVWIGYYYSADDVRNVTVQWYFTTGDFGEFVGTAIVTGAFFRMDIWTGTNPKVYHVHEYSPTAPDLAVFNMGPCYNEAEMIHFVLKFDIQNPSAFQKVSRSFLVSSLRLQVTNAVFISPLRLVNVMAEDDGNHTLYMSATMLDRPSRTNNRVPNVTEHGLLPAFSFLSGTVSNGFHILVQNTDSEPVNLVGISITRLNYPTEFTTTTTTTTASTPFLIPTLPPITTPPPTHLVAPTIPTAAPTLPNFTVTPAVTFTTPANKFPTTAAPCNCSSVKYTNPIVTRAPPCVCPSAQCSCPTISAAPTTPCPKLSCPTQPPRRCPSLPVVRMTPAPPQTNPLAGGRSSSCPCIVQQQISYGSNITVGTLVGSIIGALIVGLVLGFILTRCYSLRIRGFQVTSNLLLQEENEKY